MSVDPVEELLQLCVAARAAGRSFPEIWRQLLRTHRLVAGPLVQAHQDGKPHLEVRLVTGHRLVCDEDGFFLD